jgi:hypothetical protein
MKPIHLRNLYGGLLIGLIGWLNASCDPAASYQAELSEIDSCMLRIDTLENLLDGIEFDSLKMMVDHVKENEATIKEIYHPDTVDSHFGRWMTDSKSIRKTLTNLDSRKMNYGDELNAVKHQFMDLEEDIRNGVLDDEQVKDFLATEKEALERVDLTVMSFYNLQEMEKKKYYYSVPRVDAYIEKLKAQIEQN